MKNFIFLLLTTTILFSCSSDPDFPTGRWLLEVAENKAFIELTDSTFSVITIHYDCDTVAHAGDTIKIDSIYYDNNIWTIIPDESLNKEVKIELDMESKSKGYATLYENSNAELFGELSIPKTYHPTYDEIDSERKTLRWAYFSIKNDIRQIEKQISRISENNNLSFHSTETIIYLDSFRSCDY